ncbi:unnamed protein product [Thlaspi arvense]|uniref:Uncharacterized protein n=1 Tax=Thlaspi arvense TaxID=13288 RepID=A0AAU9RV09_THLAR|nr:unnamed protein product [Thlaspi arvense]
MDNKFTTNAEAAPSVMDTKHKEDMTTEKKISDAMEIMEGLGVRLHKIEGKVDRIEEKMDLLISLIMSNNDDKLVSVKAEAESMPMDESYSDEEPAKIFSDEKKIGDFPSNPIFSRPGTSAGIFVDEKKIGDYPSNPIFNHPGGGLFVGGRFSGGRCGGQGLCTFC